MAIARDTSAKIEQSTGSTSYTQSYTCTGSNLTLVVAFTTGTSDNITSLTYNSVAMTQAQKVQMAGSNRWSYIYYLIGPATGANNIVWTFSAGQDIVFGGAASYTGTNQSAIDGSQTDSVSAVTTMTNSQTVTAADSWVNAFFYTTGASITASTGAAFIQTVSDNIAMSDTNGSVSSGTNNQTVTWTGSASGRSLSVSIAPAAAGPANVKTWDGITFASIKTIDGVAAASIKSINGVT